MIFLVIAKSGHDLARLEARPEVGAGRHVRALADHLPRREHKTHTQSEKSKRRSSVFCGKGAGESGQSTLRARLTCSFVRSGRSQTLEGSPIRREGSTSVSDWRLGKSVRSSMEISTSSLLSISVSSSDRADKSDSDPVTANWSSKLAK